MLIQIPCPIFLGYVVCNMISAVHSDKSKSNSSVILGVIGQQRGGGMEGGHSLGYAHLKSHGRNVVNILMEVFL